MSSLAQELFAAAPMAMATLRRLRSPEKNSNSNVINSERPAEPNGRPSETARADDAAAASKSTEESIAVQQTAAARLAEYHLQSERDSSRRAQEPTDFTHGFATTLWPERQGLS